MRSCARNVVSVCMVVQQQDQLHRRSLPSNFHANFVRRKAMSPKADGTLVSALGGRPTQTILGHVPGSPCASNAQSRCARCAPQGEDALVQELRVMTRRFVKLLTAAVALGAFIYLGTEIAAARHGGGGGGWHGGGRAGGFGGARFSGRHVGGMRMGGIRAGHFSGMRASGLRAGNFRSARMNGLRAANLNGKWLSHNRFANLNGKWAAHNRFASLNGKNLHGGAWNKWGNHWHGGWNGRWGGWQGPVFWPFFYGDLLSFVFWPSGFYDPFWAYGDIFVWDAILWPGPYSTSAPGYYDVYGDYRYGRSARTRVARNSGRDVTGPIPDNKDLAQTCGGLAPGVSDLPIDRIEKTIQLNDDQLKALDALKAATSKASELLKSSCASEVSLTPLGRLETVQKRIDGMIQALAMVRAPLDNFYNSLNDEQKQRFAALGPPRRRGRDARGRGQPTTSLSCAAVRAKISPNCPCSASSRRSSRHNNSKRHLKG